MIKNFNKRGELTTQQIVGLIILITSFAVILFLLFRLNLGEISEKEICHNSVVLKGQSPSNFEVGNLDCKTNYICISGGEDCKDFNPTNIINININQKPEKIENDTMKVIAQEMKDCWWMFGEGKINYAKGFDFTNQKFCSVCSIIAFDETLSKQDISYSKFYNYLKDSKIDGSDTLLHYLYNTYKIEDLDKNYLSLKFDFKKQYFVLTALSKEGFLMNMFDYTKIGLFYRGVKYFDKEGNVIELKSLPVLILEKTKENYDNVGCTEYLTKA